MTTCGLPNRRRLRSSTFSKPPTKRALPPQTGIAKRWSRLRKRPQLLLLNLIHHNTAGVVMVQAAIRDIAALRGCTVKCARGFIQQDAPRGKQPVIAREFMQHGFFAGGTEAEYDAATQCVVCAISTVGRRSVKIAGAVTRKRTDRLVTIAAAELVKHRLYPFSVRQRKFEDCAASSRAAGNVPAIGGRPINASIRGIEETY